MGALSRQERMFGVQCSSPSLHQGETQDSLSKGWRVGIKQGLGSVILGCFDPVSR
uniref:Uncharacterized protein n=1 Tax=Anguilla anguilla TaxID=7936 RepID=A0A0E9WYR0_ANGAN